MTEPGAGSKWQGLQLVEQAERGAHPRVEPDPPLDLAELAVRLRVEPDPLQDLVKLSLRHLINSFKMKSMGKQKSKKKKMQFVGGTGYTMNHPPIKKPK